MMYLLPEFCSRGNCNTVAPVRRSDARRRAVARGELHDREHARDGITEIASGLNEGVSDLPADFTHKTLMVFDVGINAAWDSWGTALTDLQGKNRPSNDADIGLR